MLFCAVCLALALNGCGSQQSALIDDTGSAASPIPVGAPPAATPPEADDVPLQTDQAEAHPSPSIPDIIARVDGRPITRKEFERELLMRVHDLESRAGKRVQVNDQVRALLVKDLINAETLVVLAERAGAKPDEVAVKQRFEEARERMGSEDAYQAYLKREELTEEELLDKLREKLAADLYVQQLRENIEVTDEDLRKEYEDWVAASRLERDEDTTDVSHILIKVAPGADENTWQAARERCNEARDRILAGEDFAEVAHGLSQDRGSARQGGAYREVRKGKMAAEFEKVMEGASIGEISEPFKTEYGWHILKVDARHKAGTMPLDEVRDDLGEHLKKVRQMEVLAQRVAEAQKELDIEVHYLADMVTIAEIDEGSSAGSVTAPAGATAKAAELEAAEAGSDKPASPAKTQEK